MRSNNIPLGWRPAQGLAVLVLVALTGSGCAGELGKYRDAQPLVGGTQLGVESAAPTGAVDTAAAESAAGQVDSAAAPDTTAGTSAVSASTGAPSRTGTAAVGPRARSPRAGSANVGGVTVLGSGPATDPSGSSSAAGSARQGAAAAAESGSAPATPSAPPPGAGTTTGVTKDAITIGLFYPKTGAYTGLFRNSPAVVQAAFDEAGPINGRRLVLKTYDDGTANAGTIQVEEKRAKDEVFAMLSIVSESNVVVAPLADRHKVPLVVGNIDQKVALPLTYAFPVFPFWAHQATILPGFIKNVLSGAGKKIGIVYEGTSTAVDAKNAFKDKAKELALNVTFEQPIAQNQSTCANEVANLQSHGVQVVFMMNGPLGAICMLRDARALGYKPAWTGVGMSWQANVVARASGGGADGIRMLSAMATLETPAGRHYTALMRKHAPNSGADEDDVMLATYSMVQPLLEALRRSGPDLTRAGFVQTMETKMSGYDSGYLPPPTFGPKIRSGPTSVGVTACCTNGRWATPQSGWRAEF